jgi:hypothetical protein
MIVTTIELHQGSRIWHGTATANGKNFKWYYRPRSMFDMTQQESINSNYWMNVDPPAGAKQAVLKAVRAARS